MPRPAGRSGWVSTRGTVKPARSSASSATAANSGVPAKTTLMPRRASEPLVALLGLGLFLASLLDHLGLDAVALEGAEVFDEDLAHQVVHLVLHADRQQPVGIELEHLAVAVERAHGHLGMARHLVVDLRYRQAALLAIHHLLAELDQLGIDQHPRRVAVLRGVDDDDALMHVHLRGRQPDAVGGVHGFQHVVDQLADAGVDLGHGLGDRVQPRVGIAKDGELSHDL
mmetsp:Transcript_49610/g.116521  ORF Transcript_49610/g.116521 Transcript_49610/m.116521 type:complete len:227 (+) Transcript_49610:181-861(+)